MKLLLIIAFLLTAACSSTSHKEHRPIKRLTTSVKGFFREDTRDFHLLIKSNALSESNKDDYPHLLRFKVSDKSFELPISLSLLESNNEKSCKYSHLLVGFKPETTIDTPFKDINHLEVHNHCQDSLYENNVSLSNKKIDREKLIYKFQDILGFPAIKNKVIEITYTNLDKTSQSKTRSSLIFESRSEFAKRFSSALLKDLDIKEKSKTEFNQLASKVDKTQALKVHMFNALIADRNQQFPIADLTGRLAFNPSNGYEFRNLAFLSNPKNTVLLVGDTDESKFMDLENKKLSKIVQEKTNCKDQFCLIQFELIQKWRAFYSKKEFESVTTFYENYKQLLESAITRSPLDEADKQTATAMVNYFFQQLWNRNKVPVILTQGTPIYRSQSLNDPCGKEEDLNLYVRAPAGIPAFVIEETDKAKRVLLFDTRDESLTNPDTSDSCVDKKENQNWVSKDVVIDSNWPE